MPFAETADERAAGCGDVLAARELRRVLDGMVAAIAIFAFEFVPPAQRSADLDSLMTATDFDRLLGREAVPLQLSVSRGTEPLAVTELESGSPIVRLYRLETAE